MPTILKTKRRPWMPERVAQSGRTVDNGKFYRSTPWRKLRALKVRQSPICEVCAVEGRVSAVEVIDHIIPITEGGAPLDINNLQSMCSRHHNIKSGREAHKQ